MILLSNEQFCGLPSSSLFKAPGLNGKVRLRWCRPEAHALKPSQDHWLRSVPLLSEKPRSLHSGALTSDGPQYTSVGALPPGCEPVRSGLHLSMQAWLLQILPWLASIYESILLSWHVMSPPTCVITSSHSPLSPTENFQVESHQKSCEISDRLHLGHLVF